MRKLTAAVAGFIAGAALAFAATRGSAEDAKPAYVGSKKCVQCHFKQDASWKKTKLAKAMETLKPVTEADNKALFDARKKADLDPAKDYTTDAKCLACHTTGYGKDGGYPDQKITDENRKTADLMGSVSCEACHGPGSVYLEYKKKKKDEAKKENKEAVFTKEELAKVGLVTPTEENCKTCHNKDAPSQPAEPFKFEDKKKKVHDHPEVK
jgi:cytochrome c554/c'-like protein